MFLFKLIYNKFNQHKAEKSQQMNKKLVRNYFSLLIVIYYTTFLQVGGSKQECLQSCLNLLKQIKRLKHLNQIGMLEGHPDLIVKQSKYILSKLDEFYKEIHDGREPPDSFKHLSQDLFLTDDEVTNKPSLKNKDSNANLLEEVESITLKTKELIQRMNEIKFPKRAHISVTTES